LFNWRKLERVEGTLLGNAGYTVCNKKRVPENCLNVKRTAAEREDLIARRCSQTNDVGFYIDADDEGDAHKLQPKELLLTLLQMTRMMYLNSSPKTCC